MNLSPILILFQSVCATDARFHTEQHLKVILRKHLESRVTHWIGSSTPCPAFFLTYFFFTVVEAAGFPAKMRFRHMEVVLILNSFMWLHKNCFCTRVGYAFPACKAEHLMSVFGP